MQEVSRVVLVRYVRLQLGQLLRQLVSLCILSTNLSLQHPEFFFAVGLELCFVLLQLHKLVVQHLNLCLLGSQDFFMIALQTKVVHLGITLVANAV